MKKCNKETGEREDEDAVTDKSNYEEIDLSREPTEQQSLDRRTIDCSLKIRMSTIVKTTWKTRREWSAGLRTRWTCTRE